MSEFSLSESSLTLSNQQQFKDNLLKERQNYSSFGVRDVIVAVRGLRSRGHRPCRCKSYRTQSLILITHFCVIKKLNKLFLVFNKIWEIVVLN